MCEYVLVAPCHFGMEAVLKREIQNLGCEILKTEDGRVTFSGSARDICRANIFLRTPERILLQAGRFHAETFDELFENVRLIDWDRYIPKDGKFWVTKATSVQSRLFSATDIQRIVKKAVVEKLKTVYRVTWFEETGDEYPIRVFLRKDEVLISLDTSGVSLHMRGYRRHTPKAPLEETLAAGLIMLTPWNEERSFADPFCGSGTLPVEAAMIACGMAPGLSRSFRSQTWDNLIDAKLWDMTKKEAKGLIKKPASPDIAGYDIDPAMIAMAKENARLAGVDSMIHFKAGNVKDFHSKAPYGVIVTNPPYGERIGAGEDLYALYRALGDSIRNLDKWSAFVLSAYTQAEKAMGMKAAKNRKIYNGMIKTYFYQFPGPKPPAENISRPK